MYKWVACVALVFSFLLFLNCGKSSTQSDETAMLRVPSEFASIQDAIDGSANGDIILIAPGVYTGEGNRDLDFGGKLIIVKSEDGPDNTIIDCQGSAEEPHRAFSFAHKEDSNAVLEGLTIRGGYGSMEWGDTKGGAIYCDTASPLIIDCIFENNHGSHSGGAIAATGSSIKIVDCEFSGNVAEHGGAIYFDGTFRTGYDKPAAPQVTGCTFHNNEAALGYGFGGGIYAQYFNIHLTLSDCVFYENTASLGAGYAGGFNSLSTISNCTFSSNTGLVSSALHLHGNRTDTLRNNIMAFNRRGYAVSCVLTKDLTITNCNIFSNQGGDWVGCMTNYYSREGNIWQDPNFCSPDDADFHISSDSPCAPGNNESGMLIGAMEIGCSP